MPNLNFYKAKWSWPKETDTWLSNKFKNTILNFPCGMSKIGNIRADIDPSVKPDIICSLLYPPFREKSFDVVICDPPYKMYCKFKWLLNIKDLAKQHCIISTPQIAPLFRGFKRTFYFSTKNNGISIRIFIDYIRKSKNYSLNDFPKYRNCKNKT